MPHTMNAFWKCCIRVIRHTDRPSATLCA